MYELVCYNVAVCIEAELRITMWLWSVQRPDSTEVPFWYCSSMMNSSMRWQAQRWPRLPASLNSAWRPPPHLLFSCQSRSRLDPAGDDWRIWTYDVHVCVCVCVCVWVCVCVFGGYTSGGVYVLCIYKHGWGVTIGSSSLRCCACVTSFRC